MPTAVATHPGQDAVQLTWEDPHARVVIDPENADTILCSTDYILRAVLNQRRKDVSQQAELQFFKELLQQLSTWLDARAPRVREGIITRTDGCMRFVVVGRRQEYDEHLHDEALELEMGLFRQDSARPFEVFYIPGFADDDGVRAFVDPDTALSHHVAE